MCIVAVEGRRWVQQVMVVAEWQVAEELVQGAGGGQETINGGA